MNEEIYYREYNENDFKELVNVTIKSFGFDKMLSHRNAKLIAELNLLTFLNCATFVKIAEINKKPIGFLIGKILEYNTDNLYNDKIKKLKRKMIFNIGGIFLLLIYKIIKIINKNLLKNTNRNYQAELSFFAVDKNYHGLGIGRTLFEKYNDYLKENNILNFYLYTDTYCNYKFYEHFNMNKKAEKKISINFIKKLNAEFYLYDREIKRQ